MTTLVRSTLSRSMRHVRMLQPYLGGQMSPVSLTRTRVLAIAGALLIGGCWSTPEAPGGTGGSQSGGTAGATGGTGGTDPAGTGGTGTGGNVVGTGGSTASCGAVGTT